MRKNHDIIEIECKIKYETDKAYLIETYMGEAWVSKSMCEVNDDNIQLPEWLAIDKELI